jgi:hypothetical protein
VGRCKESKASEKGQEGEVNGGGISDDGRFGKRDAVIEQSFERKARKKGEWCIFEEEVLRGRI